MKLPLMGWLPNVSGVVAVPLVAAAIILTLLVTGLKRGIIQAYFRGAVTSLRHYWRARRAPPVDLEEEIELEDILAAVSCPI
jgi:hypothetical protein